MSHFHTSDQRGFLWFKSDVPQPQLPGVTYNFPGVLQLSIGMSIIMLQLSLVCCNDTRKPIQTSCISYHSLYRHTKPTIDCGYQLLGTD